MKILVCYLQKLEKTCRDICGMAGIQINWNDFLRLLEYGTYYERILKRRSQTFKNIEESKWNSDQSIWLAETFRNLPLLQKTSKDMKYLSMNFKFIHREFQMPKDLKTKVIYFLKLTWHLKRCSLCFSDDMKKYMEELETIFVDF